MTSRMLSRLLSSADVERLVKRPEMFEQESKLLLCTVVEPLLLADLALKSRGRLDWRAFQDGWQAVIDAGWLYIAPLDADCLNRALFEYSDDYTVTGLWPKAQEGTPDCSVHRLIMRPSEQSWWEDELYSEMEFWYGEE